MIKLWSFYQQHGSRGTYFRVVDVSLDDVTFLATFRFRTFETNLKK